ncbi:MAG: HAMP domain-containing sensor histidine kinase [Nitrospiraceae bacterium]|nr:HAMP domain-containing sensor histidine kinase [Nitrospiraceae bacterium]
MERIEDEMLLAELKRRLDESRIAVTHLRTMTKNLEAVNEKLRQSESLKSDFLSNIRNEINNPLAAILGLARQIADGKTDAETGRSLAAVIHHEAFELDFQLKNIFAAAELEAGEISLSPARVDVTALVRRLAEDFGHKASEKHLSVELSCGGPGGEAIVFTTDPDKLHKILANLLANAIEFNREGKRVQISARRDENRLIVSIADEGIGIPEADRKKVFDRFVQLDTGTQKRHRGHGLGLSISKAFAQMLYGSLTLTGEKNGGCLFTLALAELPSGGAEGATSGEGNEIIFDEGTKY